MKRLFAYAGWLALILYQIAGGLCHFRLEVMQPLTLVLFLGLAPIIWYRRLLRQASDLESGLLAYFFLATLVLFWPGGLGRLTAVYSSSALYTVLAITAAAPPLWGAAPFTSHFARQTTPSAAWETDLFKEINRALTAFWAALFALSALVSLAPQLWPALGPPWLFQVVLPMILQLGVGFRLNRWYPNYRQRQWERPAAGCCGLPPGPKSSGA